MNFNHLLNHKRLKLKVYVYLIIGAKWENVRRDSNDIYSTY